MQQVTAQILGFDLESLFVEFMVRSEADFVLPAQATSVRTNGLWRTTCFEVFLKPAGSDAYLEMNFSPSLAWAAYAFDRYRENMRPTQVRLNPECDWSTIDKDYFFSAKFDVLPNLSKSTMLALSAVIEHMDGTKSFWALAHPPGPPDFHHPDCFTLELAPPKRP